MAAAQSPEAVEPYPSQRCSETVREVAPHSTPPPRRGTPKLFTFVPLIRGFLDLVTSGDPGVPLGRVLVGPGNMCESKHPKLLRHERVSSQFVEMGLNRDRRSCVNPISF